MAWPAGEAVDDGVVPGDEVGLADGVGEAVTVGLAKGETVGLEVAVGEAEGVADGITVTNDDHITGGFKLV